MKRTFYAVFTFFVIISSSNLASASIDEHDYVNAYILKGVRPGYYSNPVSSSTEGFLFADESSTASSSTTTEEELPICGPVRQPEHTIKESVVTIKWQPPTLGTNCNDIYLVTVLDFEDDKVIENITTTELTIDIDGIEPCGNYRYTITTFDSFNETGEANEKSFKVDPVAPSHVTHLEYKSSSFVENASTSVVIYWEEPHYGKKCVKDYEILMWRRDRESEQEEGNIIAENITSRTMTKNDLYACEIYVLQVTAIGTLRGEEKKVTIPMAPRKTVAPSKTERESYGPKFLNLSTVNNDIKSVCYPSIARFECTYQGNDMEAEIVMSVNVMIEKTHEKKYFAIFEDLLPFSKYECSAQLYNVMGMSDKSLISGVHLTEEDVPDRPTDVYVNDTQVNSFRVSWRAPEKANGILAYYRLYIDLVKPLFIIPSTCSGFRTSNISHTEAATVYSRVVEELNPYVLYSVQVAASNGKGVGDYSDTIFVATKSAPSEAVQNLEYTVQPPTSVTEYNAVYTFTWELPCRTNGFLKGFRLWAEGNRLHYDTHIIEHFIPATNDVKYAFDVRDFKPSYGYNTTITPVTEDEETNEKNQLSFNFVMTEAGVPKANHFTQWGIVDTTTSPNPTQTAFIRISDAVLRSEEGQISYVAILLSELGCQPDPVPKNGLLREGSDWPYSLSWHDVQDKECIPQYQTTKKRWAVEDDNKPIYFTIGMSDCTNDLDFCNGPLKPGTRYGVIVRIFTFTGYSDTQMMEFETDNLIALLLIISVIAALLLSSFIVGLMLLYKKGMFEPSPGLTILPGIDEINGKNFMERYNEMTANKNEKLIKEYKTIEADTAILENYSFNAARQNSAKNRYSNIHPFDHNRVVLSMEDGDTDYINASYIDGFRLEKEYIACQGPKPETCNDFWRMILELKVESIVMLTSFKEGNKVKCAEYFPAVDEFSYYDDVIVRCTSEQPFDTYKKRTFVVEKGNDTSVEVTHYHFLRWLDHDCPKYPNELIKFVKQVRTDRKVLDVPLVVHCSAGVGRTGTFIALDIIMQKIKEEKRLNIYEIVKQLRMQRVKMVQTPGQYIYLYRCVYELMRKEKSWTQRVLEKLMKKPDTDSLDDEKSDCNTILAEMSPKQTNGKIKTDNSNGQLMSTESHI
ncbi:receptor-type tyrosine-protein phosphatase delta [Culicoides brevitarsis]|uniref:receptor-type tyrosine-protein phosphatase delta n=1 Tax=Culicoides brevitarsis TaxID=469753 RepID=UPI00307B89CC